MIPTTPQTLRALRKIAGMSQTEAARLIGVHYSAVSNYELRGESLAPDKAVRLVDEIAQRARRIAEHRCTCPLCGARVD